MPAYVSSAVEGPIDAAVVARLLVHVGAAQLPSYVAGGKTQLLRRLPGYNNAARRSPWLVLVDLDQDGECAPPVAADLLSEPAANLHLRLAVRQVEAWLMADRERIARFVGVPVGLVPREPERIADPKSHLVDLARRSSRRDVRRDIVPSRRSGRRVGPAYTARMIEFVDRRWDIDTAAARADSLARCIARLRATPGPDG